LTRNPLQEGGDDDKALSKGPTTKVVARRIQEEWDSATPRRDILLYIFEGVIT